MSLRATQQVVLVARDAAQLRVTQETVLVGLVLAKLRICQMVVLVAHVPGPATDLLGAHTEQTFVT